VLFHFVIPEYTDADAGGVARSVVLYGDDAEAGHFRASMVPPQPDPLAAMVGLLAPGWEGFTEPRPGLTPPEAGAPTFLGLDVVRAGVRLSVLRGYPAGTTAEALDLGAVVHEAALVVAALLAERE
jgi:hypothetical protein